MMIQEILMDALKLEKINNKEFQVKLGDKILGSMNIADNQADVKIAGDSYHIRKVGGNIFIGLCFEIVDATSGKFSYKTSWFGFGGNLVMNSVKYKFLAGGGGVQTWHKWIWKDMLGATNNVWISARADERNSSFDGSNKIEIKGNVDEKLAVLLVLLARYFQYSYISGR
jgi:hypothetical protein